MALIDRLRRARAEDRGRETVPDPTESALVGPGVLRADQLRVIERVLEFEVPSSEGHVPRDPVPEPLPIWVPNFDLDSGDRPPAANEPVPVRTDELEPCPNCGEESRVTRIDLTANAGWLTCRACGLRWGGTIERSDEDRDRGEAIAG
jgi:hypothetical protein